MKVQCTVVCVAAAFTCGIANIQAATIYGLTSGNGLVRFDSNDPALITNIGTISQQGIVDIDFYPANGLLYGITAAGDTYTLDISTAQATFRFSPSISLSGITDFDFDPVDARMRLYRSSTGETYQMVPDYVSPRHTGGTPGMVTVDGTFSDPSRLLVGNAYDSPFDNAGKTNQWSIDTVNDAFVLHSGGSTETTILQPVSLGFEVGTNVGFDIGQDGAWYVSTDNDLYTIRPTTKHLGTVGGAPLVSIAVAAVPEPSTSLLLFAGLFAAFGRRTSRKYSESLVR